MKTRKLLCLAIFSVSATLTPHLLPGGQQPRLAAADACAHCPMQLIAPTIALGQLNF
ncbi:hypothetical protein NGA35_06025 [Pseudomonas stutzeri]|nr:hypothetical protein [Stutzerimonas stutzeri]